MNYIGGLGGKNIAGKEIEGIFEELQRIAASKAPFHAENAVHFLGLGGESV